MRLASHHSLNLMHKPALFTLLIAASASSLAGGQKLTTSDVLRAMRKTYNAASRYQDTVEYSSIDIRTKIVQKAKIETYFARPDLLRFTMDRPAVGKLKGDKLVFWNDGAAYRTWWAQMPAVQKHETLAKALDWTRQVSLRATFMLYLLIQKEVPGFDAATNFRNIPEEERVDGRLCYKVALGKENALFWVDKQSFVLRRLERFFAKGEEGGDRVSLHYKPVLNKLAPKTTFTFTPPKSRT